MPWDRERKIIEPIKERVAILETEKRKMGNFTRSTSGTQVITGLPFTASNILFLALEISLPSKNWSIGWDTLFACISLQSIYGGGAAEIRMATDKSIGIYKDIGNYMTGTVTEIVEDGFTITFEMTGRAIPHVLWFAFK